MARKYKHRVTNSPAKRWLKGSLLTLIPLLGCAIAVLTLSYIKPSITSPIPPVPISEPSTAVIPIIPDNASSGLPLRLSIPIIGVDAAIDYVGLDASGAMDIKEDPTRVAWYEPGPRPGDSGSAVIAGHYGFLHGKGSVFNDLSKLQPGDMVNMKDDAGRTISFIVQSSRLYDPDADASAVFSSSDGLSHLNLITCEGTWNNAEQTYSNRLVVFTDKKIES